MARSLLAQFMTDTAIIDTKDVGRGRGAVSGKSSLARLATHICRFVALTRRTNLLHGPASLICCPKLCFLLPHDGLIERKQLPFQNGDSEPLAGARAAIACAAAPGAQSAADSMPESHETVAGQTRGCGSLHGPW